MLRPRVEVFCFRGPTVLAGIAEEGYVLFPGGGIDPTENAVEAAKREFAEEAARRLINCTVAHPPTAQAWPSTYRAKTGWKKGYTGGHTVWLTGSCGDELPGLKHPDYEPSLRWRPVPEVIALIETAPADWADDNAVRLKILRAHVTMRRRVGEGRPELKAAGFPRLAASGVGR